MPADPLNERAQRAPSRLEPRTLVQLAMAVGLVMSLLCVLVAQRLPGLSSSLKAEGDKVVAVGLLSGATEVTAIRSATAKLELEPTDLMEEPDVLPSWEAIDRFLVRQGKLWRLLREPELELLDTDGQWHAVQVRPRGLEGLPLAFYVQLFDALVALLVGLTTYAYSDRGAGARFYALSAIGFAVALWPVTIYSTRPLALAPEWFHWLSTVDHLGAHVLCLGLCMMVAQYPRVLFERAWLLGLLIPLFIVPDHLRLANKTVTGFHTGNLLVFLLFVGLSVGQWRACRRDPVARAALGWCFLSIMAGVVLFVTLFTVPILFHYPLVLSQAVALTAVVLIYAGMSLGVLKIGLFRLDRWWLRVWSWIGGGLMVVLTDLALVQLFSLNESDALMATLLCVGVLYFPVRQWVVGRIRRGGATETDYDVGRLVSAAGGQELDARFVDALGEMFRPLNLTRRVGPESSVVLDRFGSTLRLPLPSGRETVTCTFRNNGANLFRPEDATRARTLLEVGRSVHRALRAREQGQNEERQRIRRDLHDDLGASLARIARHAGDARLARLAKTAMADLRDVLTALSQDAIGVEALLLELESDCRERVAAAQRQLVWQRSGSAEQNLDSRQHANLVRLFREATSNALGHGTEEVRVTIELDEDCLEVEFDNGCARHHVADSGLGLGHGLANIATRLEELGATFSWKEVEQRFVLRFRMPWKSDER